MPIERRSTATELTASEDGKHFSGYAARYLEPALINKRGQSFYEQVRPGAFAEDLRSGQDIPMLWNHNPDFLLGRTASGTLRVEDRSDGLYVEADLPDTSWGNDVATLVKRGDIRGMSFTFLTKKDGEQWGKMAGTRSQLRTLTNLRALDVSPVTFPAYKGTTAEVRSEDVEQRDSGVAGLIAACDAAIDEAVNRIADMPAQSASLLDAAAVVMSQVRSLLWCYDTALVGATGGPDVEALVQAADSAISAAQGAVATGNYDSAPLLSAQQAIDACMSALRIPDPDDDERSDSSVGPVGTKQLIAIKRRALLLARRVTP